MLPPSRVPRHPSTTWFWCRCGCLSLCPFVSSPQPILLCSPSHPTSLPLPPNTSLGRPTKLEQSSPFPWRVATSRASQHPCYPSTFCFPLPPLSPDHIKILSILLPAHGHLSRSRRHLSMILTHQKSSILPILSPRCPRCRLESLCAVTFIYQHRHLKLEALTPQHEDLKSYRALQAYCTSTLLQHIHLQRQERTLPLKTASARQH
jgi:hypothetical protein